MLVVVSVAVVLISIVMAVAIAKMSTVSGRVAPTVEVNVSVSGGVGATVSDHVKREEECPDAASGQGKEARVRPRAKAKPEESQESFVFVTGPGRCYHLEFANWKCPHLEGAARKDSIPYRKAIAEKRRICYTCDKELEKRNTA